MNGTEFESQIVVRINEIRGGKRIHQKHLAQALNLSQSAVSQLLSGHSGIRISQAKTIAEALGVTFADLLPSETPTK